MNATDHTRARMATGSGMDRRVAAWAGRDMVYPTNVLHMATECSNRGHSAAFPEALPAWFVRLFTQPGDVVLDPFMGSGTTLAAAVGIGRRAIGVDINEDYCRVAAERLTSASLAPRMGLL